MVNSGKISMETILSEASVRGTCNDYPEKEYTQAGGSAIQPERLKI
jgi:hypothetical protein|tara:strand:+ start:340 stop:477 length:138 start_codon:yes stop_codon:yes gene_type:complete